MNKGRQTVHQDVPRVGFEREMTTNQLSFTVRHIAAIDKNPCPVIPGFFQHSIQRQDCAFRIIACKKLVGSAVRNNDQVPFCQRDHVIHAVYFHATTALMGKMKARDVLVIWNLYPPWPCE